MSLLYINRYRLTSASDEDDYDDDFYPIYDDYPERDRLQLFPGRIPPRKKRDSINSQPRKSRVSKLFDWIQISKKKKKICLPITISINKIAKCI